MECPRCGGVEMNALETDDGVLLNKCPECTSVWMDSGDLTRALLRSNLPGLDSLGGRPNLGEAAGTCPEDLTDLMVIEAPASQGHQYAICEVCGGVWIPGEDDQGFEAEEAEALSEEVMDFFRGFGPQSAHG